MSVLAHLWLATGQARVSLRSEFTFISRRMRVICRNIRRTPSPYGWRIVPRDPQGESNDMNLNVVWSVPESWPRLSKDEVHVWRANIDVNPTVQAVLAISLDSQEERRASHFVFGRDRNHFVAARGILRRVLSGYLQRRPEQLRFTLGPHGKPALPSQMGCVDLRFNLSHSGGLALVAVALEREVGIDLEKIQPGAAGENIETSIFSQQEQSELHNTPPESRQYEFFRRWTCKEAYVKARGGGLQIPLKSFEVSLVSGQKPRLRCADSDLWDLVSFSPREDFAAALVLEGKSTALRFWDWS
jgi:4'-phosphopantetheinyl transferase